MISTAERCVVLFVALICTWLFREASAGACLGCVELDELNFDKTIARFPFALIKFDIAFPYGDKHEAFAAFVKLAHEATDELLIGAVGIKDYGQMENLALGDSFMAVDKTLPGIFLFKGSSKEHLRLPKDVDVTTLNLQRFVMDHTPLYIGLEGTLKQFNALARNFAQLPKEAQLEMIAAAEQLKQQLSSQAEKTQASNYVAFMRKISEKGYGFVQAEARRLKKLKEGKVSEVKKAELTQKQNVLEAFRVASSSREEL